MEEMFIALTLKMRLPGLFAIPAVRGGLRTKSYAAWKSVFEGALPVAYNGTFAFVNAFWHFWKNASVVDLVKQTPRLFFIGNHNLITVDVHIDTQLLKDSLVNFKPMQSINDPIRAISFRNDDAARKDNFLID